MDPQIIEVRLNYTRQVLVSVNIANSLQRPTHRLLLIGTDAAGVKASLKELTKQTLAMLGPAESAIVEEHKDIPMRDGFQSSIKITRPSRTPAGGSPLIVFFFGGKTNEEPTSGT